MFQIPYHLNHKTFVAKGNWFQRYSAVLSTFMLDYSGLTSITALSHIACQNVRTACLGASGCPALIIQPEAV